MARVLWSKKRSNSKAKAEEDVVCAHRDEKPIVGCPSFDLPLFSCDVNDCAASKNA